MESEGVKGNCRLDEGDEPIGFSTERFKSARAFRLYGDNVNGEESPFGKVIYSYTREQAIEDGVLVDITNWDLTKEAGFTIPTCLTNHLHGFLQVPNGLEDCQDFKGRLWDVLQMARMEWRKFLARMGKEHEMDSEIVNFEVLFQQEREKPLVLKRLWLVFNAAEGFTIMFPEDY